MILTDVCLQKRKYFQGCLALIYETIPLNTINYMHVQLFEQQKL
jgi:hypothetical protein